MQGGRRCTDRRNESGPYRLETALPVEGVLAAASGTGHVGRTGGWDQERGNQNETRRGHVPSSPALQRDADLDPLRSEALAVPAAIDGCAEERSSRQGKRRRLRNGGEGAEQSVLLVVDARREEQGVGRAGRKAVAKVEAPETVDRDRVALGVIERPKK